MFDPFGGRKAGRVDLMKAAALLAHHGFYSIDLAGRMIALLAARGELPADAFERYLALVNAGA